MDVSSATAPSSTQVEALKKSTQVQEQQILSTLEKANEQAQQVTAQKTGVGGNLNITG